MLLGAERVDQKHEAMDDGDDADNGGSLFKVMTTLLQRHILYQIYEMSLQLTQICQPGGK